MKRYHASQEVGVERLKL